MAKLALPSNNAPVEVIAAAAKGVVQCSLGVVLIENAADPSQGLRLNQGDSIAVDGWTGAWFAQSGTPGKSASVKIATE